MRASACGSRESLLRASAARGSALSELIVRCFCSERDAVLCADPGGNNNLILGITIPKPPAQRAVQTPVPRSGLHLTASRAAGYTDTGPAQRATFDSVPRSGLHLTACRVREQRVLLVSLHFILLLVLGGINHLAIAGGIRAQRASQCCPGGASTQQSAIDKQSRLRFSDGGGSVHARVTCVMRESRVKLP